MEHILSLSYGKDSMACLGAIEQLGWPLDRVITVDIWATPTIPADLPPMVDFKARADAIIKARYSIEVEHYCSRDIDGVHTEKATYEDGFYHRLTKGKHIGAIKGWPMQRGPWCQKLKLNAIAQISKVQEDNLHYLGIAADETERIARYNDSSGIMLPLAKIGWNEAYCRQWCAANGLLSPIYTTETRCGCWMCHNQGAGQLRRLRRNYPELWALMLKWDADSPVTFHADGHSVNDFDKRFQMEDQGLIFPDDRIFRWDMLEQELNYRIF